MNEDIETWNTSDLGEETRGGEGELDLEQGVGDWPGTRGPLQPPALPDRAAVCWQHKAARPLTHSMSSEAEDSCCWIYQT